MLTENKAGNIELPRRSFVGIAAALMTIAAILTIAGVFAGIQLTKHNVASIDSDQVSLEQQLVELKADSAARGTSISLATGYVDGSAEGLFVLDHLTGNLQCWLINTRTGSVGGIYRANVASDMNLDQVAEADYVMVTGSMDFAGGRVGRLRPGLCICYVADSNSGAVVCYGIQFDKTAFAEGVVQESELIVITGGVARGAAVERDQ